MRKILCTLAILFIISLPLSTSFAGNNAGHENNNVCESLVPAAVGGPVSHKNNILSIRWLGAANLEMTYKGSVILFSAYFGRGPDFPVPEYPQSYELLDDPQLFDPALYIRPDGYAQFAVLQPEEVIRADAVFLGHAHGDHMQDAAQVAMQTGATVYGPEPTIAPLVNQGLPSDQMLQLNDGDFLEFKDYTVEAVLVLHSGRDFVQTPPEVKDAGKAGKQLMSDLSPPASPEQIAWQAAQEGKKGGQPPVLAYLFTFGKDFRVILYDTANPNLTPEVTALMQRIGGKTDVCSVAFAGSPEQYAIPAVMPEIKLFNAKYFIANHHDSMNLSPSLRCDRVRSTWHLADYAPSQASCLF